MSGHRRPPSSGRSAMARPALPCLARELFGHDIARPRGQKAPREPRREARRLVEHDEMIARARPGSAGRAARPHSRRAISCAVASPRSPNRVDRIEHGQRRARSRPAPRRMSVVSILVERAGDDAAVGGHRIRDQLAPGRLGRAPSSAIGGAAGRARRRRHRRDRIAQSPRPAARPSRPSRLRRQQHAEERQGVDDHRRADILRMALREHQRRSARRSNGRSTVGRREMVGGDIGVQLLDHRREHRPGRIAARRLAAEAGDLDAVDAVMAAEARPPPGPRRGGSRSGRGSGSDPGRGPRPRPRSGSAGTPRACGRGRRAAGARGEAGEATQAQAARQERFMHCHVFGGQSLEKIASIGSSNMAAIRKASGRLGSYLPVSIALTLCRETSSRVGEVALAPVALGAQHLEPVLHAPQLVDQTAPTPSPTHQMMNAPVQSADAAPGRTLEKAPDAGHDQHEAGRDHELADVRGCADIRPAPRPASGRAPRPRRSAAAPAGSRARPPAAPVGASVSRSQSAERQAARHRRSSAGRIAAGVGALGGDCVQLLAPAAADRPARMKPEPAPPAGAAMVERQRDALRMPRPARRRARQSDLQRHDP